MENKNLIFYIIITILFIFLLYVCYEHNQRLSIVTKKLKLLTNQYNLLLNETNEQLKLSTNSQFNTENKVDVKTIYVDTNLLEFNNNKQVYPIPIKPEEIQYHINLPLLLNNIDNKSEYSENSDINIQILNKKEEDDDEDDYIFDNGKNAPRYASCNDSEVRQKIKDLKNELNDTDSVKIDTEFIKKKNPLLETFASIILDKISDNITVYDNKQNDEFYLNEIINDKNNNDINLHHIDLMNEIINNNKNSIVNLETLNNIDENHLIININANTNLLDIPINNNYEQLNTTLLDIQTTDNDEQLDTTLLDIQTSDNDKQLDTTLLDIPTSDNDEQQFCTIIVDNVQNIEQSSVNNSDNIIKNNIMNKYKKMSFDAIKLSCIEYKIKLSSNKKQKRKNELINDLINYILNLKENSNLI
jgi:hypothetical protein